MLIRVERFGDEKSVRVVNLAAFPAPVEADLVDALRSEAEPHISLVAEDNDGVIVGHIMFSPVTLALYSDFTIMGLAPMAVLPEQQRKGIGSKLVEAGLEQCRVLGIEALVVLGHPEYYPRFGFLPAAHFGIDSEYEVPDEVFMARELQPGALNGKTGRAHYHEAFGRL